MSASQSLVLTTNSEHRRIRIHQSPTQPSDEVFVMYHGTKLENVESILKNGLKASEKGMLGAGVYASREIDKTLAYGPVTFTLIVLTGRVCRVEVDKGPETLAWQKTHDTAWVPNGVVPSGRQENCVKDANRVRILGIIRGFDLLEPEVQKMTRDYSSSPRGIVRFGRKERALVNSLLKDFGLGTLPSDWKVSHGSGKAFDSKAGSNKCPSQNSGRAKNTKSWQGESCKPKHSTNSTKNSTPKPSEPQSGNSAPSAHTRRPHTSNKATGVPSSRPVDPQYIRAPPNNSNPHSSTKSFGHKSTEPSKTRTHNHVPASNTRGPAISKKTTGVPSSKPPDPQYVRGPPINYNPQYSSNGFGHRTAKPSESETRNRGATSNSGRTAYPKKAGSVPSSKPTAEYASRNTPSARGGHNPTGTSKNRNHRK